MRVSQHSGREGNARHNDRTFLDGMTAEERAEKAPNIDAERTAGNAYFSVDPDAEDFRHAEIAFYAERYGASIEATNSRYRAEGHAERCKSVLDVYTGKQTQPEEIILQIGNQEDKVNPEIFLDCVQNYLTTLDLWNAVNGNHMQILNTAIHLDEASPHAHIRRVWDYTDRDGLTRIGQNKALEAAGIPLPDPGKPQGRYNNRKMVFDAEMRGRWQEIAKAHGFQIETEPRPNMRHKDKAEYIADQLQGKIDTLEKRAAAAGKKYATALEAAQEISRQPLPETVKKGIGSRRREVVEMNPGEYQRIHEAMAAASREADRQRRRADEAERKEQEAKRERAALEKAVKETCTEAEQAKIWMRARGIGIQEPEKKEPERKQARSKGRSR